MKKCVRRQSKRIKTIIQNQLARKRQQLQLTLFNSKIHNNLFVKVFSITEQLVDFIQNYIDPQIVEKLDFTQLKNENPNFIDESNHVCQADIFSSVPIKKEYLAEYPTHSALILVILEHKSVPEDVAILQSWEYTCSAELLYWRILGRKNPNMHKLPAPFTIIVYHGRNKNWQPPSLKSLFTPVAGMTDFYPDMKPCFINLSAISYDKIKGNAFTRATIELLKRAMDGTLKDHLWSVLRNFKDVPRDKNLAFSLKTCLGYAGIVLGGLTKEQTNKEFDKAFGPKEGNTMSYNFIDEIEEKSFEKGKREGILEGKRESILEVLGVRFGIVPAGIKDEIHAKQDLIVLESLLSSAKNCSSLEDFAKDL